MSHTRVSDEHDKKHEKSDQRQSGQVEQTDSLIEVIDRQAADFERRLETGAVLSASEIATARTALDQERTELQEHLLQLPPRSPTVTAAFHATDRVSEVPPL